MNFCFISHPYWRTPKNEEKTKITYLGNRNPWTDRYKILHVECRPWRNHACQFCEDRLRDFGVAKGRIWPFPLTCSSPLKHSRTTVRVCEVRHWQKLAKILQRFYTPTPATVENMSETIIPSHAYFMPACIIMDARAK